jgi:hypothetical protein
MQAALITLAVFGIPAIMALSAIWRGYVLSIIWGWFIVPTFGLPALSIPVAIGLSVVVGMLTSHATKTDGEKNALSAVLIAFFVPVFALLVGWIAKSFI